jgi:CRP/FNR family transcriptional regulator, anaerobic regulatory protein
MRQVGYHQFLQTCCGCGKVKLCLADELIGNQLDPMEPNLIQDMIRVKGRYIYYQDEEIKNLFFVKSGSVKSVYFNQNGDQQIINFHYPGEIIGLAHLNHSYHSSSAITLEKSVICAFSLRFILANCEKHPNLLTNILKRFNAELKHRHESLLSINHRIASKRLGNFLLDVINRQFLTRNKPIELHLTMSRADMANYLGLAPETVSRVLSKYEKSGLIFANKKKVRINNLDEFVRFVS